MSQWAICHFRQATNLLTASGRLVLLFVVAVGITALLADHQVMAGIFQSPAEQSPPPPAEEPAEPQPQPQQQQPTQPPPAEQPPAEQPPAEQAPANGGPVSPVAPGDSPVLPAGNGPPPMAQPTPRPIRAEPLDPFLEEEAAEATSTPNFILDQIELIDTIVVSGAYIWLCCGAVLFLLIPLVFLFLQIRGQIKIRQEENL